MATITIRFKDGDQKDWTLHEAMDLGQLTKNFASANGSGEIGFGVASEAEDAGSADYWFVGLRMEDVRYWPIDGMVETKVAAALFAELETFEKEQGGTAHTT